MSELSVQKHEGKNNLWKIREKLISQLYLQATYRKTMWQKHPPGGIKICKDIKA